MNKDQVQLGLSIIVLLTAAVFVFVAPSCTRADDINVPTTGTNEHEGQHHG